MILGNCLEVMPTLPKKSHSMVAADLPYGATGCAWDKTPVSLLDLWAAIKICCINAYVGAFFANWSFGQKLCASNHKHFRYEIVWRKSNVTGFFGAKHRPLKNHEYILIFGPGKCYNPQMTPVGPENRYCPNYVFKSKSRSVLYGGGQGNQPNRPDLGVRYPRTVHFVPSENRRSSKHPTQKPVALLDWLVRTYSNPGDTVLDPVSGSGTTAVAALRCGRNVNCVEKDESYFEASVERVHKAVADGGIDAKIEVRR